MSKKKKMLFLNEEKLNLAKVKKEFFPYRLTPSESYHEEWAIHFTINNGQKQKEISTGIKAKNNNLKS